MPRLSIDISDDEHRSLKARAALQRQSLKDYVLARALADAPAEADVAELAELLRPRIERADRGEVSQRSIRDIARQARAKRGG